MTELNTEALDHVFLRVDEVVASLEDEGYPFEFILDVFRDYLELADEYLL